MIFNYIYLQWSYSYIIKQTKLIGDPTAWQQQHYFFFSACMQIQEPLCYFSSASST